MLASLESAIGVFFKIRLSEVLAMVKVGLENADDHASPCPINLLWEGELIGSADVMSLRLRTALNRGFGDFMAIGGNCFCFHARKEKGKEEEEGRAGVGEEGGFGGGG